MDAKKLVSDLLNSGMTQSQLAALVPCSQSLISALLNGARGTRLSYAVADRLRMLHSEIVLGSREDFGRHRSSPGAERDSGGATADGDTAGAIA